MIEEYEKFVRERMKLNLDWGRIPCHMYEGISAYVLQGRRTGSFIHAIFSNNLQMAVGHADGVNRNLLQDYVHFLMLYVPPSAYGTEFAVQQWQRIGGQWGVDKQSESGGLMADDVIKLDGDKE